MEYFFNKIPSILILFKMHLFHDKIILNLIEYNYNVLYYLHIYQLFVNCIGT